MLITVQPGSASRLATVTDLDDCEMRPVIFPASSFTIGGVCLPFQLPVS